MKKITNIVIFSVLFYFTMQSSAAPVAPILTYSVTGLTVIVNWTNVPGATEYKLNYAPIPYTGPHTIGTLNVGANNSFSATLWEGAAFYIAVQAGDGSTFSEYSNIDSFTLTTSSANLTGNWTITETLGPNNCGENPGQTTSHIVSFNQSGNSVTASFGGGSSSGSIIGNTLSLSGSIPEDGGTTESTMNLSILTDNNSLSGSESWSWSDGESSCSGTSSITGFR